MPCRSWSREKATPRSHFETENPRYLSIATLTPDHQANEDVRPETPELTTDTGLKSFHELGLLPELVEALDQMGITTPLPIQQMTIEDALAGRDVCGKAQTGSGKTLAFGLPLVQRMTEAKKRRPRGLVLVPTRELANQVADGLAPLAAARRMWVTAIYGGASIVRQIKDLHAGVEIVIATPGRLNDLLERKEISLADVEMVVLDEADQMADMGFLPQVRAILDTIESEHQTLLFSATLDGSIGALIRQYQHDPVHHEVANSTGDDQSIEQRFIGVERSEKVRVAAAICGAANRSIVFVRTKHGADRLAEQLSAAGVYAAAIHGGLNQNRRERVLHSFATGRSPVLVATNVAARGIHVDGIETVLHYDLPEDSKTYLHRSGRTARAGADGLVVTLVLPDEMREADSLQRGAGTSVATVSMGPDDDRLRDLASWTPPVATRENRAPASNRGQGNSGGGREFRRGGGRNGGGRSNSGGWNQRRR